MLSNAPLVLALSRRLRGRLRVLAQGTNETCRGRCRARCRAEDLGRGGPRGLRGQQGWSASWSASTRAPPTSPHWEIAGRGTRFPAAGAVLSSTPQVRRKCGLPQAAAAVLRGWSARRALSAVHDGWPTPTARGAVRRANTVGLAAPYHPRLLAPSRSGPQRRSGRALAKPLRGKGPGKGKGRAGGHVCR